MSRESVISPLGSPQKPGFRNFARSIRHLFFNVLADSPLMAYPVQRSVPPMKTSTSALAAGLLVVFLGLPPSAATTPKCRRTANLPLEVAGRTFLGTGRAGILEVESTSTVCLSCHDGTVSMAISVRRHRAENTSALLHGSSKRLQLDPGSEHPVDVPYPFDSPEYVQRSMLDPRIELEGDRVTCTTCHSGEVGALSIPITRSELCLSCHLK